MDSNKPKNVFFSKLPYEIAKSSNVTHIIWLSPWKNMILYRNYLRQLVINNEIILLEKTIKINDALSLFKLDIFLVFLSIIINKKNVNTYTIDGVEIDSIVYDELYRSFTSSLFFNAILIDSALQKASINKLKL